jgi:hypothetical protein
LKISGKGDGAFCGHDLCVLVDVYWCSSCQVLFNFI